MEKKYYILGNGYQPTDLNKTYPYEVWLTLNDKKHPFILMQGKGMGGIGGNFSPSEILKPHWKEHLILTNTTWILSLCEEASKNNDILDSYLTIETYEYIYKEKPKLKILT